MALTKAEQAELDALEAEEAQASSGLTLEEEQELASLEAEEANMVSAVPDYVPGYDSTRDLFKRDKNAKGIDPLEAMRLASTAATFGQQPRISALTETAFSGRPYGEALKEHQGELKRIREETPLAASAIEIPVGMAATGPLKAASMIGKVGLGAFLGAGYGSEQADLATDEGRKSTALSSLFGGGIGAAGGLAEKGLNKLAKTPQALEMMSKKAMLNATGATGSQVEKFAPDAADQIYNRNMVRAFDTPETIAKRAQGMLDDSNQIMDNVISELEEAGVKVDKRKIVEKLKEKISAVATDPAKKGDARQLQSLLDDIEGPNSARRVYEPNLEYNKFQKPSSADIYMQSPIEQAELMGSSGGSFKEVPLTKGTDKYLQTAEDPSNFISPSSAEKTKRGFQDKARSLYAEPERGVANKTAGSVYRQSVEDVATEYNPALADQFKEAKQTYGLVAPIQEAAEKRANQRNQMPWGAFMDTVAFGAGAGLGGEEGAASGLGFIGLRRFGAPRAASTAGALLKYGAKATQGAETLFPKLSPMFNRTAKILSQTESPAASQYMMGQRELQEE